MIVVLLEIDFSIFMHPLNNIDSEKCMENLFCEF